MEGILPSDHYLSTAVRPPSLEPPELPLELLPPELPALEPPLDEDPDEAGLGAPRVSPRGGGACRSRFAPTRTCRRYPLTWVGHRAARAACSRGHSRRDPPASRGRHGRRHLRRPASSEPAIPTPKITG